MMTSEERIYGIRTFKCMEVMFKLDMGSEANLIPMHIYCKISGIHLEPARCLLVNYRGQRLKPEREVQLTDSKKPLRFQVTSAGSPILGKDACIALNLISCVNALQSTREDSETQHCAKKLVNTYSHVFEGLGTIKSNSKIHTEPSVTPSIDPPIPMPLKKMYKPS